MSSTLHHLSRSLESSVGRYMHAASMQRRLRRRRAQVMNDGVPVMQRAAPRARVLHAHAEHTEREMQRAEREREPVHGHVAEQTRAPERTSARARARALAGAISPNVPVRPERPVEEHPEDAVALRAPDIRTIGQRATHSERRWCSGGCTLWRTPLYGHYLHKLSTVMSPGVQFVRSSANLQFDR